MSTEEKLKPGESRRRIVFLRHGVAFHNILDPTTNALPDLTDKRFFDPTLTSNGKIQAVHAGDKLRYVFQNKFGVTIDLIVTSPLTRCLQTTLYGFLPGDQYCRQDKEPNIVCNEDLREAYGMHYPDKRREKSFLQKHFPLVEFDEEMDEEDKEWCGDSRETVDDVLVRIERFMQWLSTRPEETIVVVSHGVWIEACLNTYCPAALDFGKKRVYNCNLFAGQFISRGDKFYELRGVAQLP